MARKSWGNSKTWSSEGGGGTTDYDNLDHKPSINGVTLNSGLSMGDIENRAADDITGKLGYKILQPNASFASQVTAENTIYEIRDVFDLNAADIVIPSGSTLKFNGGIIKNGSVTFQDTILEGNVQIVDCVVDGMLSNNEVYVDWFGAKGDGETDDSEAMKSAVKVLKRNGGTLIFGRGKTYIHGDGISNDTDDPNHVLHTGYSYDQEQVGNVWHIVTNKNDANIGRDIELRFLGFDNLTIEGNGASIVSHSDNGICKHNAIMLFAACIGVTVKNLTLDGKRKERTKMGIGENGWKCNDGGVVGSWTSEYTNRYEQWRNGEWIDSNNKGFHQNSNLYIYGCNNMVFDNVVSTNPLIDGLIIAAAQTYTITVDGIPYTNYDVLSHNITLNNCVFSFAGRSGIDVQHGIAINIVNSEICWSGYYDKDNIDSYTSANHNGIDLELESDPGNGFRINCIIDGCEFHDNDENGCILSKGNENCICRNSMFVNEGFSMAYYASSSGSSIIPSKNNILENCTFINGTLGISQEGAIIRHNKFYFNKDFRSTYFIDASAERFLEEPITFEDNLIECDLTDLTVTYNGNTYLNAATLLKNQGSYNSYYGLGNINISGIRAKIINNRFINITPSRDSSNIFWGPWFSAEVFKGNVFLCDYIGIYRINDTYTGYVQFNGNFIYNSHTNVENIDIKENSIPDSWSNKNNKTLNFNKSGYSSERPIFYINEDNFIGYKFFDKTIGKEIVFSSGETLPSHDETTTINQSVAKKTTAYINNPFTSGSDIYVDCYNTGSTINTTSVARMWFVKSENDDSDAIEFTSDLSIISASSSGDGKPHAYGYYNGVPDPSVYTKIKITNGASSVTTTFDIYEAIGSHVYYGWVYSNGHAAIDTIGSTQDRPIGKYLDGSNDIVGDLDPIRDIMFEYFDTTLGKPIYVSSIAIDGTVTWIDATGTVV